MHDSRSLDGYTLGPYLNQSFWPISEQQVPAMNALPRLVGKPRCWVPGRVLPFREQFQELRHDLCSRVGKAFWVLGHKLPLSHSKYWVCFPVSTFWNECFKQDGCWRDAILSISAEMWGFCADGRCCTQMEELNLLLEQSSWSFLLSEAPLPSGGS